MPDPISASITASLIASGFSATAAATTVFVGGVVATAALSAGVGLLSQQLLGSSAPGALTIGTAPTPDVRGNVKQATPAQRIVLGLTRFGGAFHFYKVTPPYLHIGQLHSALPMTSFDQARIGAVPVPLDAAGLPIAPPYLVGASTPRIRVAAQDGSTLAQPINPILTSSYAELGADHRLPGIAESVWEFDYGADFDEFQSLYGQVQIPDAQWIGRGCPIPDPRNPAHVLDFNPHDVDELWAAIATWDWTNNASLIQGFWAAMPFGLNAGPSRVYTGQARDALMFSADFDDEPVPLASGGVERRHSINGVVGLDQNPLGVMEEFLTANRGFISPRAGSVRITSSQPREPVVTLTDDMLAGGFSYRDRRPQRDLANLVRARFVSSERDFQWADAPSWRRDDLIATDAEPLEISLKLPFTDTHTRAQRLEKATLEEARLGRTIVGSFDLRALGAVEGTIVRYQSRRFPMADGVYEVVQWGLSDDLDAVTLELAEYDPTIARNWTATVDEQAFALDIEEIAA